MKRIILSGLILATIGITIIGCNKEKVETVNEAETIEQSQSDIIGDYNENMKNCVDSDTISYFLNGNEVKPGTFDPANEDLYGIIHSPDLEKSLVGFYYFTDKNDYFQFGRDNGYGNTLEGGFNFEKGMRQYIEVNDVEEYYAENNGYPEGYLEFERELYAREVIGNQDRGLTWLFLNYSGGGSTTSITGYKPFFAASEYNDAISRYKQFGSATIVYGWMTVYDKKWYRQKIGTVGSVTWSNVSFQGGLSYLDNKMTSCVAL